MCITGRAKDRVHRRMSFTYVICGFGQVGRATARALLSSRNPQDITVIERDFTRLEAARAYNYSTVFGDASEARTLRIAQVGTARDLFVCVGAPGGSAVVKAARGIAPEAQIRVATPTPEFRNALIAAGADDVIVISDVAGMLLARSLHS